jgi:hypothetical protein
MNNNNVNPIYSGSVGRIDGLSIKPAMAGGLSTMDSWYRGQEANTILKTLNPGTLRAFWDQDDGVKLQYWDNDTWREIS